MLKDNFFDRKSYLEVLEKRVIALKDGYRQNIAFIGDEQVGKTAILHKFSNSFLDNRFLLFYLEVRPESLISFCRRFAAVLLYNFLCSTDVQLKEDLEFLMEKSSVYIPKTVSKVKTVLADAQRRKKDNVFSELLSLTNIIHQETGKFCVVIFDEFQNLEALGIKSLYKEWAQRLMLEKSTMFIIASSAAYKAKAILSGDLSLLFGNFEVITVEPLNIKSSSEYLKIRLGASAIKEEARNFIIHFTGGYPVYLDIFCQALIKSSTSGLVDALENLLFAHSGILNQKFTDYLKRFQDVPFGPDYLAILHLISNGRNKAKDISHILKKPVKLVNVRINYLLCIDVIVRSGDFLKISDRVFGFWLKFVYQEKINSLIFDVLNQKISFRKNIETMIQEFISSSQKPVAERVTELLRLFADERAQIERRKVTFNHFREIKPLDFESRSLKEGLICRSSESLWIFGFKQEMLTEEDISEFSRECKKYRNKLQKKIIVSLKDIDANSQLKALDEKVWTWDLNSLNQIMDLFSKPRIIA
jgi:hypothetical protein